MQETSLDKHHLAEEWLYDYARGAWGGKNNELIKLLAHSGVDDGEALPIATCKRLEKGATPRQSNSTRKVKNSLTDLFYSAINMNSLNAFCTFSCRSPGQQNPAPNNKALSD